jgi:hypothetical protein
MWNGTQWVPNQPPPYPVPQTARPYESARYRSLFTTAFLAGTVVGLLLLITFDVVDAIYSQTPHPSDGFTFVDGLVDLVAVVAFYGTFITSIVFFCMWLHRVVRNMPSLGSPDPRWSPARAVGFCFVPVLNLFQPFWSVLDAWRGADPSRRWADAATRKAARPSALLVAWWASWLIGGLLSRIAFRMNGAPGDEVDLAANIVLIVAAVLAILVVRGVTARQDRKNELITNGGLV